LSASAATLCECSTPYYMLISACGACQNRSYITLEAFDINCPQDKDSPDGVYPEAIDEDTRVPQWAFIKVADEGGIFDPGLASLAGDTPESTWVLSTTTSSISSTSSLPSPTTSGSFVFIPTVTISGSDITITSTSSPTSTTTHTSSGGGGSSNVGAISGGVVGGVIGLLLLAILGALLYRKKMDRRGRDDEVGASKPMAELEGGPIESKGGGTSRQSTVHHQRTVSGTTLMNPSSFSNASVPVSSQGPSSPHSPTSPQSQHMPQTGFAVVGSQQYSHIAPGQYTGMPEGD